MQSVGVAGRRLSGRRFAFRGSESAQTAWCALLTRLPAFINLKHKAHKKRTSKRTSPNQRNQRVIESAQGVHKNALVFGIPRKAHSTALPLIKGVRSALRCPVGSDERKEMGTRGLPGYFLSIVRHPANAAVQTLSIPLSSYGTGIGNSCRTVVASIRKSGCFALRSSRMLCTISARLCLSPTLMPRSPASSAHLSVEGVWFNRSTHRCASF